MGINVYKDILGYRPKIALVNEQCFSKSLIDHYKKIGYEAVIMEWENAFKNNSKWNKKYKFFPQVAKGTSESINLIWNQSIAFQKFQRYAHGENSLSEYIDYIESISNTSDGVFSIYGNDAEIFNYRPGRFLTESVLKSNDEWIRIEELFLELINRGYQFIKPSESLKISNIHFSNHELSISSIESPLTVKKQRKYNPIRWAVSGRDDLGINTRCWRLSELIGSFSISEADHYKELCYLWSSDFRTHITEKRWHSYLERLKFFESKFSKYKVANKMLTLNQANNIRVLKEEKFSFNTKQISVDFNLNKGISIDKYKYRNTPIFGTLEHGYFDDIHYIADFFSGHFLCEIPGKNRITDLCRCFPELRENESELELFASYNLGQVNIDKKWSICLIEETLTLSYKISFIEPMIGSIRFGYITLNPETFNNSIKVHTKNGGSDYETFIIDDDFNHGSPVSFLISSNNCFGATNGVIKISNNDYRLIIKIDKNLSSCIPMMSSVKVDEKRFTRLFFSAEEIDDTSKEKVKSFEARISIKVQPLD